MAVGGTAVTPNMHELTTADNVSRWGSRVSGRLTSEFQPIVVDAPVDAQQPIHVSDTSVEQVFFVLAIRRRNRNRPYSPGGDGDTFAKEFGSDARVLAERQFYLCDSEGKGIGTASAWWNDDYFGRRYGQVHWVAIVPQMQNKGLAKPLISVVCKRIKELGDERAFLGTSIRCVPYYERSLLLT